MPPRVWKSGYGPVHIITRQFSIRPLRPYAVHSTFEASSDTMPTACDNIAVLEYNKLIPAIKVERLCAAAGCTFMVATRPVTKLL